jgi:hypothetical protein
MPKLDSRPARTDLTDRECTKIIGGILGSLSQMTDLETLRGAVRWWAETDGAWEGFASFNRHLQNKLKEEWGENA